MAVVRLVGVVDATFFFCIPLKKNWEGGTAEKKAQIPGLDGQTSDYLTSARARHRTSCLLVLDVGMLTYTRCLSRKDCVQALPSPKTKLALSQFPIQTCLGMSPINPALSVTSFAEAVTSSTDKTTLFCIPFIILALLLCSIPVVTQIPGRIAVPSPPSPLRCVCLAYIARIIQHFLASSTRVEL